MRISPLTALGVLLLCDLGCAVQAKEDVSGQDLGTSGSGGAPAAGSGGAGVFVPLTGGAPAQGGAPAAGGLDDAGGSGAGGGAVSDGGRPTGGAGPTGGSGGSGAGPSGGAASGGGAAAGGAGGAPPLFPDPVDVTTLPASTSNPPECPDLAPENPVGDCLGLPVYLNCVWGDDTRTYSCVCDWYHWLCI